MENQRTLISVFQKEVVGRVGLEPTANALKGHCSTTQLPTFSREFKQHFGVLPKEWQLRERNVGRSFFLIGQINRVAQDSQTIELF